MTQVVQARCPNCQKVLRIPADWIAQPLRCKHCKQVFQGKAAPDPEPTQVDLAPPPAGPQGLFEGFEDGPLITSPRPRRASGRGWKVGFVFLLVFAVVAGSIVVLAGPTISSFFHGEDPPSKPKVVQNNNPPPVEKPPRDKPPVDKPPVEKSPIEKPPGKKPTKKEETEPKTVVTPPKTGAFPRRALLINVNDYLLMNPLSYGAPTELRYPGSSTSALAFQFTKPPLNMPDQQITELCDGIPDEVSQRTNRKARAPLKEVIEHTLTDFLDSSRAQDRIIVLFAGHVVDGEKECYLVPVEGNKDDPKTLVPLAWVYDKLAKCKARQKLLILDVCRFPPARGLERPAPGEMSEQLDTILQQPPAGVQVWSSCVKGQQSIELEKGSVFLQSLCSALMKGVRGIQEPTNALPLDALVPDVNKRMKEILESQKVEQLSRLTGTEPAEGAPYDPAELMPARLEIRQPNVEGGAAGFSLVDPILREINALPSSRNQQFPVRFAQLPPFSAKMVADYKADYKSWDEVKKDPEKHPLGNALITALESPELKKHLNMVMEDRLFSPGGAAFDGKAKAAFLNKQKEPGLAIFEMRGIVDKLKAAGADREKETSKRWVAHYDYALARLQSRLIYVYEYNYLLGQIRADNLPALEPMVHNGWRLGSRPKVQVTEPTVKDMVKNVNRSWKRIAEEYAGTPWAVLATRESLTALGMEWRPTRD